MNEAEKILIGAAVIVTLLIVFFVREEHRYRKNLKEAEPLSDEEKLKKIAERQLNKLIREIVKNTETWLKIDSLIRKKQPIPMPLRRQIGAEFNTAEQAVNKKMLGLPQQEVGRQETSTNEVVEYAMVH